MCVFFFCQCNSSLFSLLATLSELYCLHICLKKKTDIVYEEFNNILQDLLETFCDMFGLDPSVKTAAFLSSYEYVSVI